MSYDLTLLRSPREAIRDLPTFKAGWGVLALLLVGFFGLEPLGVPVSLVAAVGALILLAVAKRGHAIDTGKVLRGAPWQIVVFSLGMYLVVYGLRNAGLTDLLSGMLDGLAERGLWVATFGTGFLTAFLSSIMNNMPTVLVGALSIDGSNADGVIKQAMIYANVIGSDSAENYANRQPGYVAVAACAVAEKYRHHLGILLPGGDSDDTSGVVRCVGRSGPAPVALVFTRENPMSQITIYHNPACGTSRNTLALIRNSGVEPAVILYLETPPSREQLVKLIADMGISARELLRKNVEPYQQLGLADAQWSDDKLIDFMLQQPILINRPIVVTPLGTRLCRPSEAVLDILPDPQQGAFSKEDGEPVIDAQGQRITG